MEKEEDFTSVFCMKQKFAFDDEIFTYELTKKWGMIRISLLIRQRTTPCYHSVSTRKRVTVAQEPQVSHIGTKPLLNL